MSTAAVPHYSGLENAMKWLLRILAGLVALVVLLVVFVFVTLRPTMPETQFQLRAPERVGDKHVLLFGATGKLGLELAADLTARGDRVTAFVRNVSIAPEYVDAVQANLNADDAVLETLDPAVVKIISKLRVRDSLGAMGILFVSGDAVNKADVEAAFAAGEYDAVITTIGNIRADPPPDYIGNANIFDAAKAAGVQRVILVSTIGAGDSLKAAPFISRLGLSAVIPLKTQAEDHLRASGLDYTIVRPGGLPFAPPTGNGILSEDPKTMGFIVRGDLARLIVGVLDDDRTIGKTLAAMDPTIKSPF
ncbi:MAG: NAD(P)H-binding protein [Gammaproteobacteria bacterium]|nr:NAD(P)H-binding protein [Gammaproteobacteria bacterium]